MLTELLESNVLESADDSIAMEAVSDEDMAQLLAVSIQESLSPDELTEFVAEMQQCNNLDYVEERTIVKLDKKAKKTRNYKMAILQCAKEGEDPNYKKICTLWKMERFLMRLMEKKWMTKAKSRAKTMGKTVHESEAGPLKKIAPKLTRAQRDTLAAKHIKQPSGKLKAETNTVMKKLESRIK